MNQKKKKKDLRKHSGGWGNVTQSDLAVPEVRTIPHEEAVQKLRSELETCDLLRLEDCCSSPLQLVRWLSKAGQCGSDRPPMGRVTRLEAFRTGSRDAAPCRLAYIRRGPYNGPYSALIRRGAEEEWVSFETATWEQMCRSIMKGVE